MITDLTGKSLRIYVDGEEMTCPVGPYVKAKTKQLQNFGYGNLTEEIVLSQIIAILNKERLNVIGLFMQPEVLRLDENISPIKPN